MGTKYYITRDQVGSIFVQLAMDNKKCIANLLYKIMDDQVLDNNVGGKEHKEVRKH